VQQCNATFKLHATASQTGEKDPIYGLPAKEARGQHSNHVPGLNAVPYLAMASSPARLAGRVPVLRPVPARQFFNFGRERQNSEMLRLEFSKGLTKVSLFKISRFVQNYVIALTS
jgi:hypothetical protein